MPCYDGRDSYPRTVSHEAIVFNSEEEFNNTVLYKSVATPLLCEAMEIIKKHTLLDMCSSNLIVWHNKHEKDDLDRVRTLLETLRQKQKELDELYTSMDEGDVELMKILVKQEEKGDPSEEDRYFGETHVYGRNL
jgi:hypothetical protein